MTTDKYFPFSDSAQSDFTLLAGATITETGNSTALVRLEDGHVIAPTAPTTAAVANTAGLVTDGAHSYVVTYVTAAGETLPSDASSPITVGGLDAPGACTAALATDSTGSQLEAGTHKYKITFVTATGETAAGTASNTVTNDGTHTSNSLTAIPTGPTGTTDRNIYRTAAGGSTYALVDTISDNSTTTYTDITPDGSRTTAAPSANTTDGKVTVTVPVSADPDVTDRNIYRTVSGDTGDYKLVAAVGDNVATTYTDNTADGSLGSSAPTSDDSRAVIMAPIYLTAHETKVIALKNAVCTDMEADHPQGKVYVNVVSGAVAGDLYGR